MADKWWNGLPDWALNDVGRRYKHNGFDPHTGMTRLESGKDVIMAEIDGMPVVKDVNTGEVMGADHPDWKSGGHITRYEQEVDRRQQTPMPLTNWNTDLSSTRHEKNSQTRTPSNPDDHWFGIPKALSDHFDPTSAKYQTKTDDVETSSPTPPPAPILPPLTPTPTSPLTPTPTPTPEAPPTPTPESLPTTLAEAYGGLNKGLKKLDQIYNWQQSENDAADNIKWNTQLDSSVLPSYDRSPYSSMDVNPDIYTEDLPAGVGFNDVDLSTGFYDTVLPSSQPKTGLQALRDDEESKGLLYASGKYWAENADGKLEAIPTDLIDGEGTARQQAIAFIEKGLNNLDNGFEAQEGDQPTDWGTDWETVLPESYSTPDVNWKPDYGREVYGGTEDVPSWPLNSEELIVEYPQAFKQYLKQQ